MQLIKHNHQYSSIRKKSTGSSVESYPFGNLLEISTDCRRSGWISSKCRGFLLNVGAPGWDSGATGPLHSTPLRSVPFRSPVAPESQPSASPFSKNARHLEEIQPPLRQSVEISSKTLNFTVKIVFWERNEQFRLTLQTFRIWAVNF